MAQDPIWMIGNQQVDFRAGGGTITTSPLPTSFSAAIPDGYEYQGQVAQYSQNVQCDENGDVLFFIVDGNVYNRDGLLIADNVNGVSGAPCQVCTFLGSTQVAIIPVVGQCAQYYIVSSQVHPYGVAPPSYLRVGVLDLRKNNQFSAYSTLNIPVLGRFLSDSDDDFADFDLFSSNLDFQPVMGSTDEVYQFEATFLIGAEDDIVRFNCVQLQADEGYLMTWSTANRFRFILFRSDGIRMVLDQNKALVDQDWRDHDASYRGELDSKQAGNVLQVVYSEESDSADFQRLYIRYWEFDISALSGATPTMVAMIQAPLLPRQYRVSTYPFWDPQVDHMGDTITAPRVGGLEFSPNGQYVYLVKSTNLPDLFRPDEPRSNIWYVDLAVAPDNWYEAINMGPVTESDRVVDGQLEYVRSPDGLLDAMMVIGIADDGTHWLGACFNPDTPTEFSWEAEQVELSQIAVRNDPADPVEYRLLNEHIDGNTHWQYLQQPTCCEDLVRIRDRSRTIPAGSYNWSNGNNSFFNEHGPVYIATELRIAVGAHVAVTGMEFRFGPGAGLVIEPGASFNPTNCTFTSACGERWAGITVLGNRLQNQGLTTQPPYQGYLNLQNCLVENAVVGAIAGRSTMFSVFSHLNTSGGVILASGTTFRNCIRGVRFMPYQNFGNATTQLRRNRSRFFLCTFTVNEEYTDDADFKAHADLWKVDGLRFLGCRFDNLRNDLTESQHLGDGILGMDAQFTVKPYCTGPNPCDHGAVRSSFIGLDHGIHALMGGKKLANFTVNQSDFTNNICGVLTEGVIGAVITENHFVLGDRSVGLTAPVEDLWNGRHRAVYSFSSYAFRIDDNTVTKAGSEPTEGIVVGYSRDHNDIVFRNECTDVDRGYIGEGVCIDVNPLNSMFVGLQFLCNQNSTVSQDFWNRMILTEADHDYHTIRTFQGNPNRPADNTFDRNQGSGPESDFKSNTTYSPVTYFSRAENTAYDPEYRTIGRINPEYQVFIPADNCAHRWQGEIEGEPWGGATGIIQHLQAQKLAYGNTRYLYDQLIDGGSTDEVVEEITSAWPSDVWELRAYLLAMSPYLSVDALKEMVDKGILPPAVVTEICVANPEATQTDGFIKWLEFVSLHPLPDYMIAQIEASWNQRTYRFALEGQLAEHHTEMTQAANDLLHHYQADTIGEPLDSVRWVWQQVRSIAGRYAEVLSMMDEDRYVDAQTLVEAMPQEKNLKNPEELERLRMLEMLSFAGIIQSTGRSMEQLTVPEQDELEGMIANTYDRPAVWAQNLLCYVYDRCKSVPTGGDGEGTRMHSAGRPTDAVQALPLLQLMPNPAQEWVRLDYSVDRAMESPVIVVQDVAGRTMTRLDLTDHLGQRVLDTRMWLPGVYTVQLLSGGSRLATEKLVLKP